jgi:hypothetical protein
MKPSKQFIGMFAVVFVIGLALVLIVPFATRSSRADQQSFTLSPGDSLTVSCPTKIEGMRHGADVMLKCQPGEAQPTQQVDEPAEPQGDDPNAPSGAEPPEPPQDLESPPNDASAPATLADAAPAADAPAALAVTAATTQAFLEQGGKVAIDAEHVDENIARSSHTWSVATDRPGFAAEGFMVAQPVSPTKIDSNYATTSPELRYNVNFTTPGTYYVWARMWGETIDTNSIHIGLDGAANTTADKITIDTIKTWTWTRNTMDNAPATITVATAGVHTINVWMREDGTRVDRLYLTTSSSDTPADAGPAESARGTGSTAPTPTPGSTAPTPTPGTQPTPTPGTQPTPATGPNPLGCAPGEISTDAQAWWMPVGSQSGNNFGHLHTTVCFPHQATLSGKVNFRIRSVMHNNPGQFKRLMVQIFGPNHANPGCNDDYAITCVSLNPVRTIKNCASTGGTLAADGMTCTWWDTLTVDTSLFDNDGLQEFRFRGFVAEPDGNDMRTSTGLHATLKNGHPVKSYTSANFMEARGWYESVNYTVARLNSPPVGTVSGVWKPSVALKPGSGGTAVTSWYASVDGDFHKGNPGTPVCPGSVSGMPDAPICGTSSFSGNLSIDTTKLANGWHRLFLKADARSSSLNSTNSGVLAILFEVKN